MKKLTNPFDNIRVASPCPADWNQMFGNDRKRFCGQCKLNVYNLSDLTRAEAEDLLLNSEGCLCVRYFQRADGTILTKNCPVGWQALKDRTSRAATAAFSLVAGLLCGIFAFGSFESKPSIAVGMLTTEKPNIDIQDHVLKSSQSIDIMGGLSAEDLKKLRVNKVNRRSK